MYIDFMNRFIEKRQGEIAKVRQERIAEFAWHFEMEATDAYLATLFKEGGLSDYVEGVNENRIMTSSEARQRCEEFARAFSILQSLTRQARLVEQDVDAETYVESEKGVTRLEVFLHSNDPQREGIERSQGNAGS
jgi:hypothetical protein